MGINQENEEIHTHLMKMGSILARLPVNGLLSDANRAILALGMVLRGQAVAGTENVFEARLELLMALGCVQEWAKTAAPFVCIDLAEAIYNFEQAFPLGASA